MSYFITVTFPKTHRSPKLADNSVNPFWELIDEASANGYFIKTNGNAKIEMRNFNDFKSFSLPVAMALLAVPGTEVTGYPCFVELSTDPSTTDHPSATDPDTGAARTWAQWTGPTQTWNEISGKWYSEPQPSGILIPLSEVKALQDAGVTIIEVADYQALQAE